MVVVVVAAHSCWHIGIGLWRKILVTPHTSARVARAAAGSYIVYRLRRRPQSDGYAPEIVSCVYAHGDAVVGLP